MKNKILLIVTMLFVAFSLFGQGNRINIQDQLEKSDFSGSIIVTNGDNEQTYLQPGAETGILTISGGVPTWVVGATGEMTTVTDQANGLNINLTGFDITIEHNVPELSTAGSVDAINDLLYLYDDSAGSITKTSPSSLFGTIVLPDLSDVPAYPTGTTDGYVLVRDDATDSNSWQNAESFSSNIYNIDGTLNSERYISAAGNNLWLQNGAFVVDTGFVNVRRNGGEYNVTMYNSGGGSPGVQFNHSNGTFAAPTQTLDGDRIGLIQARGYSDEGSTYVWSTSRIEFYATEDQANTSLARGSDIQFRVVPNGTGLTIKAFEIDETGDILAGTNDEIKLQRSLNQLRIGDMTNLDLAPFRLDYGAADNAAFVSNSAGTRYFAIREGNSYIASTTGSGSYVGESYGSSGLSLYSFLAQGSAGAATATQDGDYLLNLAGTGYDGSTWSTGNTNVFLWRAIASENYTPTAQGKEQMFRVIENGGITGDTSIYLHNNGDVSLGDNNDFFYNKSGQSLQLSGDAYPEGVLEMEIDDGSFDFDIIYQAQNTYFDAYSATNANAEHRLNFRKSRGSRDTPTAAAVNDKIAVIAFQSESLTGMALGAGINSYIRAQSSDGYYMADINFNSRAATGGEYTSVSINENGYLELLNYGSGNVEAEDVSLIESDYTPHFATANGTIIERLRTKHANILYVHPAGDSTTAVIGDPFRPYSNPFEAVQVADSGDLVIVYPGYWSVGNDVAADIQKVASEYTTYSLYKNGVDFYFYSGATIELIGTSQGAFRLFGGDGLTSKKANIYGEGSFIVNNQYLYIENDNVVNSLFEFNLEAEHISFNDTWCIIARGGDHIHNIKIKTIDCNSTISQSGNGSFSAFWFTNSSVAKEVKVDATIEINQYNYNLAEPTGDFGSIATLRHTDSSNVVLKVGNVSGYFRGHGAIMSTGGANATVNNTNFSAEIGNVNLIDTFVNSVNYTFFPDSLNSVHVNNGARDSTNWSTLIGGYNENSGTVENNNFTISIDNIQGNVGANVHMRGIDFNNKLTLNVGNIEIQDSFPAVALSINNVNDIDTSIYVTINLKGTASSNGYPIMFGNVANYATGSIRFNGGIYKNTTTGNEAVYLSNDWSTYQVPTTFNNVTFLVKDAPVFKTISGTSNDVLIQNCYTNTLIDNNEAVERIDTIKQSIYVK